MIAVVLQGRLARVGAVGGRADVEAIARSFAQNYEWVIGMSILALLPAVVLWRVELGSELEGRRAEVLDEAIMEVPA